jgi:hypothetical protein
MRNALNHERHAPIRADDATPHEIHSKTQRRFTDPLTTQRNDARTPLAEMCRAEVLDGT